MCCEKNETSSKIKENGLQRIEQLMIKHHQQELSRKANREISFEEARADWEQHCASEWRATWMREYLARQREEILKHKWIESEKAQRDLGSEAVFDWIHRYAQSWREAYEMEQQEKLLKILEESDKNYSKSFQLPQEIVTHEEQHTSETLSQSN